MKLSVQIADVNSTEISNLSHLPRLILFSIMFITYQKLKMQFQPYKSRRIWISPSQSNYYSIVSLESLWRYAYRSLTTHERMATVTQSAVGRREHEVEWMIGNTWSRMGRDIRITDCLVVETSIRVVFRLYPDLPLHNMYGLIKWYIDNHIHMEFILIFYEISYEMIIGNFISVSHQLRT